MALVRVRCPGCGVDRKLDGLGLASDGRFDERNAAPNELTLRTDTFAGRGRIYVERGAVSLPIALGVREMLKFRLAQVEADIRAAGVELDDD